MRVEVIRAAPDGCAGTTWAFELRQVAGNGTLGLVLEMYAEWECPTRRHRARPLPHRCYGRSFGPSVMDNRHWADRCRAGMGFVPPVPEDVEREARERLQTEIARLPLGKPTQADVDSLRAEWSKPYAG